jgi:hypothetical protein
LLLLGGSDKGGLFLIRHRINVFLARVLAHMYAVFHNLSNGYYHSFKAAVPPHKKWEVAWDGDDPEDPMHPKWIGVIEGKKMMVSTYPEWWVHV